MSSQNISPQAVRTASLLIIGNEILSGRTQDKNIHIIAAQLFAHGVDLLEVRIVPDDASAIIPALRSLAASYDNVFTTGGIGPTHDDITAKCIAQAFGRDFGLNPEADTILADCYRKRGLPYNDRRQRMACMPHNVQLIANCVSGAPGFQCDNVFVLPGVPHIMEAMFDDLLSTGRIPRGMGWHTDSLMLYCAESEIAPLLHKCEELTSGLQIGSYPGQDAAGNSYVNIVLRHRDSSALEEATIALHSKVQHYLPERD